jgi:hypothetical protein
LQFLVYEELHDFCSPPTVIIIMKSRTMRWEGHVVCMGEKRDVNRFLFGKSRRKETTRRKWEDNIEIVLREIEWGGMDMIFLAQDRDQWMTFVNTVMSLRVP